MIYYYMLFIIIILLNTYLILIGTTTSTNDTNKHGPGGDAAMKHEKATVKLLNNILHDQNVM